MRSIGTCTAQAQVGKMGRWKGTSKDVAGDGAVRGSRSLFRSFGQFFFWFLLILLGT